MIIHRYIYKEILNTLLAVTLILLLVFLSNQLVRYLSFAASGKLAPHFLFQLLGFEIPYLLAILLPLGLYLGIILSIGRFCADSEMSVMQACGFGLNRLSRVIAYFALFVTVAVIVLTFWINPMIASHKGRVIAEGMSRDNMIDLIIPGRFQVSSNARRVVYVEKVSHGRKLAENIFIAEQANTKDSEGRNHWIVVSAATGTQTKEKNSTDRFVVAKEGFRYEGVPGQNDYKIIQFNKYSVRVPTMLNAKRIVQESMPLHMLWNNYQNPASAAEFQWRFAMPISAFILALLAIPLSHVRPRRGRYSQLFPAILIYVIYLNLLFMARSWIEQKVLPVGLGMWWVHLVILFLVFGLFAFELNWHARYLRWRSASR